MLTFLDERNSIQIISEISIHFSVYFKDFANVIKYIEDSDDKGVL